MPAADLMNKLCSELILLKRSMRIARENEEAGQTPDQVTNFHSVYSLQVPWFSKKRTAYILKASSTTVSNELIRSLNLHPRSIDKLLYVLDDSDWFNRCNYLAIVVWKPFMASSNKCDIYLPKKFDQLVDKETGHTLKSLLLTPYPLLEFIDDD